MAARGRRQGTVPMSSWISVLAAPSHGHQRGRQRVKSRAMRERWQVPEDRVTGPICSGARGFVNLLESSQFLHDYDLKRGHIFMTVLKLDKGSKLNK